jgi:hypothetical protein
MAAAILDAPVSTPSFDIQTGIHTCINTLMLGELSQPHN